MFTEKFKTEEISGIKEKIASRPGYYDRFNMVDDAWDEFQKSIDKLNEGDMETINIRNPLYFRSTDKQYVFDVKNPQRLKTFLLGKLDEMIDGADSLIDAINDLSVKTADEDDKEAIQRRVKLAELMIKMGKRNNSLEI